MIITKTINTDLWIRERTQELYAVQGDSCTRKVAVNLFANAEPWTPEGDVSVAIRFRKPDGNGGSYDTLPTGEKAWELEENTVSFILAPQMLTVPGRVAVQVELLCGAAVLGSFPLHILVEKNAYDGATRSENYFNWSQRLQIKLQESLKKAKDSGLFDGPAGPTPNLQIGTVTTLNAGSGAEAAIRGTAENPILDLGLPRGADAKIDATLTLSGQAADAGAVGAALAGKAPAFESAQYPGCYYRTVNGETEWINPPVVAGAEYRTTERWNGKAVYLQLVDFGILPDNSSASVAFLGHHTNIIDVCATAWSATEALQLPAYLSGTLAAYIYVTESSVVIRTTKDMTSYSCKATVKYTKD